ncbi:hypothetical protein SAMN02745166_03466 [Prosthecobacter debontii]|uniref:Uncharacterized protein n=1 Tax=Prosthecobacter debontii TaxID=48467 RepID=A0A1T4YJ44_9BACT|nr:hypothetical protein SAMN02745166_03466 [Prosthecobacter debontii]
MQSFARSTLLTLAFLAVACAQVFGTQRGYLCDHGKVALETVVDHCHKASSDEGSEAVPCEESDSVACESKGEKKTHQPLQVDLQVTPATLVSVTVPAFVAVLMDDFFSFDRALSVVLVEEQRISGLSFEDERPYLPSAAVEVASCIVILV